MRTEIRSGVKAVLYFAFLVFGISTVSGEGDPLLNEPVESAGTPIVQSSDPNTDPNFSGYRVLVYDCLGSQNSIQDAMRVLGINNFDIRNSDLNNHITLSDLVNHDILIVGWGAGGTTDGLNPNVLAEGITGRIF